MTLISELLEKQAALHFTLIDPQDQTPQEAGFRAKKCQEFGTDAIMIGGSTVRETAIVDATVKAIKKQSSLPTILFPNSALAVSEFADYIFFMSLLNSRDYRFLLGEQFKGAPLVNKFAIKSISMAYIVISTTTKKTEVEKAAKLDTIQINDIDKVVNYALTARYLNLECIYLEAGSGAEKPVSNEMISAVKNSVPIPLIVGGGIRDGQTAREKIAAGADIIVTGTVGEEDCSKVKEIIKAIKS